MRGGELLAGLGLGAGLTYFFDPNRGPRRRARVRDALVHGTHVTSRAVGVTGRDALHRTYGTAASLRSAVRRVPADDAVLVERVRARLGRLVSHPHAIRVTARDGVVTLAGPILTREADRLLQSAGRVRGVRECVDDLERYEKAGNIPALQGGRQPAGTPIDLLQDRWAPATRCAMATCGFAAAAAGLMRGGVFGRVAAMLGLGLLARAAANLPAHNLVGVGSSRRAIDVQKTITIDAPVGEVYAFWSEYENFPRFMSRVLQVRPSRRHPQQSHWKVMGPAGVPVQFDAEIRKAIPKQLIAWRTVEGSPVAHSGIVRFDAQGEGRTRVHIRMSYNPPAGWVGHSVAAAFGVDPKSSMDADLVRMKTLIETGRAPHDAAARRHERV